MLNGIQITDQSDHLGHIVLRVFEGEFIGCEYYYDKVGFADAPNGDGTINMTFEYTITNGYVVDSNRAIAFNKFVGDNLIQVMEDAMVDDAAVYHGGIGGTYE